jgi:hypothetical protein
MMPSDIIRMKQMEDENAKFKKLTADLSHYKLRMKHVILKKQ